MPTQDSSYFVLLTSRPDRTFITTLDEDELRERVEQFGEIANIYPIISKKKALHVLVQYKSIFSVSKALTAHTLSFYNKETWDQGSILVQRPSDTLFNKFVNDNSSLFTPITTSMSQQQQQQQEGDTNLADMNKAKDEKNEALLKKANDRITELERINKELEKENGTIRTERDGLKLAMHILTIKLGELKGQEGKKTRPEPVDMSEDPLHDLVSWEAMFDDTSNSNRKRKRTE